MRNFKGAADVGLLLAGKATTPVITLIGLNESGKTTILEGLSYFVSKDSAVSEVFEGVHTQSAISNLIPIHKKAAFTGSISVTARVLLDEGDVSALADAVNSGDAPLIVDPASVSKDFTVSQVYNFVDSVITSSSRTWGLMFQGKLKGKKAKTISGAFDPESVERKAWWRAVESVSERLPRISYFPTFLVDMPSRIYLAEHDDERPVNRYYRSVLQDVLTSVGGEISLEKHVCKRITDFKQQQQSQPAWISLLFGSPSKSQNRFGISKTIERGNKGSNWQLGEDIPSTRYSEVGYDRMEC